MMTSKQEKTGAVTILMGTLIFILTGVIGYVGVQANKVPTLEATFKTQVQHLNKNLTLLTKTAQETNGALESYTKHHAANLARITEAIVTHRIKLEDVGKHCDKTEEALQECKNDTNKRIMILRGEIRSIQDHDNAMEEEVMRLRRLEDEHQKGIHHGDAHKKKK